MPDKRRHRGPHPQDAKLFATEAVKRLRSTLADFSLLLSKGYAEKSALKLVGDRFSLTQRQRLAVMRSACSDQKLETRKKKQIPLNELSGKSLIIDGYNVLITIESAMSGGVIFKGRDGCCRDLASIHGTYRKVQETIPAVELIGEFLNEMKIKDTTWLLDSPVSNSGRLKTLIAELAEQQGWTWDIRLLTSPDHELINSDLTVASSDGVVLDECRRWTNLARDIIEGKINDAEIVDLAV
ncbi:MAG TPA: DUF434 domain-containing protein [Planctomycetes bacterium]|nr:DUF434 domain-containing protein [Planctomycetota bacterium]